MRKPSRICESQWTSDVSCIFWIVSLSICYWLVSDNLSLQKSRWNVRIEIYIQNTYRQQVTKTSPHKPVCERYLLSGSALRQAHKINYCTCIGTCSLQKRVRAVRAYIYIICTDCQLSCLACLAQLNVLSRKHVQSAIQICLPWYVTSTSCDDDRKARSWKTMLVGFMWSWLVHTSQTIQMIWQYRVCWCFQIYSPKVPIDGLLRPGLVNSKGGSPSGQPSLVYGTWYRPLYYSQGRTSLGAPPKHSRVYWCCHIYSPKGFWRLLPRSPKNLPHPARLILTTTTRKGKRGAEREKRQVTMTINCGREERNEPSSMRLPVVFWRLLKNI